MVKTSIQLNTETKDKLDEYGKKGDTYESIILSIISELETFKEYDRQRGNN